ncbi:hypothetical protein GCM10010174_70090 [Kutzneria viridogrisea]|uniref:Uncharacterized protein n=1 Tax=Kutzneria viridogrisea TaxID=47990 RepID=A0ABR6BAU5_9PSEU|nr:hypothetical protein [Kutzneria viridogrisea]
MPTYENVVDGEVVERVIPVDGDYTDTLLGCKALEYQGGDGWRREGQVVEQAEESNQDGDGEQPPAEPAKPADKQNRSARDGS